MSRVAFLNRAASFGAPRIVFSTSTAFFWDAQGRFWNKAASLGLPGVVFLNKGSLLLFPMVFLGTEVVRGGFLVDVQGWFG